MTSSASGASSSSSSSSSVSSPSPAALDHYDIDFGANGELGSGSFATVRRGVDRRNGRTVAVKLCRIERMEQLDLEALEVEVDVLQRLKHPHIMDLYDYAVDDEYHYLFTEYLPGGELFDRIIAKYESEDGCYSERDVATIMVSLIDALNFCHQNSVVHRDIKPENILLASKTDDSQVKLIDFGFAGDLNRKNMSTPCGTPGYVAPEIINAKDTSNYGPSVDVWSMGVIMYILCCGYPPFHDDNNNVSNLYMQIRRGDYTFDEDYWSGVSQGAKDVIDRMLVVDVRRRATMQDLLDDKSSWLYTATGSKLQAAAPNLKRYLAQKRWKKGIHGVLATVKMKNMLSGLSSSSVNPAHE
jgi:calcium/calmodulin-dependent protein kinase I